MEFFSFDANYLQRLREGDFPTEQHFVAYFSKLMLIKLRPRLRSSHDLDDIRQETFVRVLKALRTPGSIHSPESLGAYVNTVCNNVLREYYRSHPYHDDPIEPDANEPPDRTIDLDGMLDSKHTRNQVRQTLAKLPQKDRMLLRAMFLEEMDKDEICRKFGVGRDYLRVLLHRAKQNFRIFYQKEGANGRIQ